KAAAKPEKLKVDAVIVTHGHGDHLGDAVEIANRNDCPIIGVYELVTYCQEKTELKGHADRRALFAFVSKFAFRLKATKHRYKVTDSPGWRIFTVVVG
ncbi:MBL fold metallo-hydrolase, partial [Escherichia coli]|uniref:MBL fold metallo-hydrolase n=1 Tax=Escherichia coli TaxID=562 RepID=UPI00128F8557